VSRAEGDWAYTEAGESVDELWERAVCPRRAAENIVVLTRGVEYVWSVYQYSEPDLSRRV
jgi:hypothetical protein